MAETRQLPGSAAQPLTPSFAAWAKEEYALFLVGVLIGGALLAWGRWWLREALREEKSAQGVLIEIRSAKTLVTTGVSLIAASVVYLFVQTLVGRLLSR
jgi:hypothetical protein